MRDGDVAVRQGGDDSRSLAGLIGRIRSWREARQAVKYAIVGVSNVAIDFGLYALLVSIGVWYPLAKTLSLVVATANGYTLNRRWTFRAGAHRNLVLTKYVAVQAGCLATNLVLLVLLIEVLGLHQIAAQAVALPIVALLSFLAQRLWTFGYAFSS
jgi:putative flippase GtrA